MSQHKQLIAAAAVLALAAPAYADDLNFSFYGSARIHAEAVQPDDTSELDSYTALRDAYSRIGFNADYALTPNVELFGQLELPLDLPNKAVQDPWDQDQDIRIGQIGLRGDFGTFAYGQMWLPYYNAIAFPVDMFSSYYSGFATHTVFRRGDTIAFYSPGFNGLSFSAAWSEDHGDDDDRLQLTASYGFNDTTISMGIDDLGGDNDTRIYGASLMHTMGNLYIGAKYEVFDTKADFDGNEAMNLYVGYTLGKNTFKAMVAKVEGFGENIFHAGWDHQFNDQLKFFVEYYYEEETAAITEKYGGLAETDFGGDGGQVFLGGLRYDF
ncbi:porin [Thioalkalivibrio denitrificans]|uniref:Porin n=1 Tax=Thioalkalivibrio denitrificans TaxID=108003 RepID=A0A1V3NS22_9GAMM|nr:porin [Thioalkalivibrio denitrificans]OOG27841.1 porin [Thioalkalivibrio denitrificans]